MDSMDSSQPPRAFPMSLDAVGKKKLTDTVKAKLAEFMESYADDVLAEYIVVLVSHGKHQLQATEDLEAFLGDQSEAFVSWLWAHLTANLDTYTGSSVPAPDVVEDNEATVDEAGPVEDAGDAIMRDAEQPAADADAAPPNSEAKNESKGVPGRSKKDPEKHRLVKLKRSAEVGLPDSEQQKADEVSVETNVLPTKEGRHGHGHHRDSKRARSPEPWSRRRRSRVDGKSQRKSDASPPRVKAPTRLLESAIRDAVAPSGLLGSQGGGALRRMDSDRRVDSERRMDSDRRLRSVVLADAGEANGRQRTLRPLSDMTKGIPPAIAVALKAAAAAAADVSNSRHGRGGRFTSISTSVWDRLGDKQGGGQPTRDSTAEEVARTNDLDEKMEDETTDQRTIVVDTVQTGTRHNQGRRRVPKDVRRLDMEPDTTRLDRNNMVTAGTQNVNGVNKTQALSQTFRGISAGGARFEEKQEPETSRPEAVEEGPGKYEFFDDIYEHSQEEDNDETIITLHRPAEDEEADAMWQWSHAGSMDARNCLNVVNTQTWKVYPEMPPANDHFSGLHPSQNHSLLVRKDLAPGSRPARAPSVDTVEDKPNGAASAVDTKDVMEVKRRMRQVELEMTKLRARQAEVSKEVQKTGNSPGPGVPSPPTQRSQQDIDLHSVLVSNVHFATTQEVLTGHFKQCGAITQVKIVSDAAGKPTGSAYIEFVAKDSLYKALALNDSSLNSRVLKVVRKEAPAVEVPAPPRTVPRPLIMPIRGMARGSFMRGTPVHMRRSAVGSRSFPTAPHLQWKREAPSNGETSKISPVGAAVASRGPVPASLTGRAGRFRNSRSLSYVRSASSPTEKSQATEKGKASDPLHEENGG